jgi:prevent-host-death family protein
MQALSAKEAKNGFGRLIDLARAEPVLVEKHGRGVVVVMAVEEFERLTRLASAAPKTSGTKAGTI